MYHLAPEVTVAGPTRNGGSNNWDEMNFSFAFSAAPTGCHSCGLPTVPCVCYTSMYVKRLRLVRFDSFSGYGS